MSQHARVQKIVSLGLQLSQLTCDSYKRTSRLP